MPAIEESWQPYAEALGYKSEREMLIALYEVDQFSIKEISKILGPATWSVRRRLLEYSIPLRTRGGPNRQDKRKLMQVADDELHDLTAEALAEKYNTHTSTVYAERRLRKLCNSVQ